MVPCEPNHLFTKRYLALKYQPIYFKFKVKK